MTRDSFVFYASFWSAMKKMGKADKLAFVETLCGYALEDTTPSLSGNADLAFGLVKPQLDANIKRRTNGEKGKGFGKLGGRPTTENPIGVKKENPIGVISKTPNVNVNVNDNVYIKESSKEKNGADAPARPRFQKPSIEEVKKYVKNMGYYGFDVEHFYSYYESNGWKVGKNPMKDWTAAVRSWRSRDKAVSQDYISRTQLPDPSVYENIESTI